MALFSLPAPGQPNHVLHHRRFLHDRYPAVAQQDGVQQRGTGAWKSDQKHQLRRTGRCCRIFRSCTAHALVGHLQLIQLANEPVRLQLAPARSFARPAIGFHERCATGRHVLEAITYVAQQIAVCRVQLCLSGMKPDDSGQCLARFAQFIVAPQQLRLPDGKPDIVRSTHGAGVCNGLPERVGLVGRFQYLAQIVVGFDKAGPQLQCPAETVYGFIRLAEPEQHATQIVVSRVIFRRCLGQLPKQLSCRMKFTARARQRPD